MRVSTSNFYESSTIQLNNLQGQITDLSSQISTGKKNITPQDDPTSALQILNLQSSSSSNNQLVQNRTSIKNMIGSANSALTNMQNLLQSINEQAIAGQNGSISNSDQSTIASSLNQQLQQLISLANSSDGQGHYLFGGLKTNIPPIASGASVTQNGVTFQQYNFQGDTNVKNVQILPGQIDPNNLELNCTNMSANVANIFGTTNSNGVSTSNFLGLLSKAIAVLQSPSHSQTDAQNALLDLSNSFSVAYNNIINNLSVNGLKQNNLDNIDQMAVNQSTQDSKTLSAVQDTDYNKALSDLSQQQLELQAAQKSFQQISSLSLFNYIQ